MALEVEDITLIGNMLESKLSDKLDSIKETLNDLKAGKEEVSKIRRLVARHDERVKKNSDDIEVLFDLTKELDDDCETHRDGIKDTIDKKGEKQKEKREVREEKKRDTWKQRLWDFAKMVVAAGLGAAISAFSSAHKG
jgi:chromosome segregation ATPase